VLLPSKQEVYTKWFLGVPRGKNPEDSNLAIVEAMLWALIYLYIGLENAIFFLTLLLAIRITQSL
jgi:hypothetical protein